MKNHTIRLEESCGNVTWTLPDAYSKFLYTRSEKDQHDWLSHYTSSLRIFVHFLAGTMQTPPAMQDKYLKAINIVIKELANEGIKEIQKLKEGT